MTKTKKTGKGRFFLVLFGKDKIELLTDWADFVLSILSLHWTDTQVANGGRL